MVSRKDLKKIARARLRDAEALFKTKRYDGAVYICGYAVELQLKHWICRTLDWSTFPSTSNEFQNYRSFRTHDLEVLLHLSGFEEKIRLRHLAQWTEVLQWAPEMRYRSSGLATKSAADRMLRAAKALLAIR